MPEVVMTPIEKQFWECGKDAIEQLSPQEWIDGYRVDFFIPNKNVVIELDGHEHHKSREARTRDAKRERYLQRKGFSVIRFTGSEIHRNVQGCVQEVVDILQVIANNKTPKLFEIPLLRYCIRMQEVITHLADKHGIDLAADQAYLRLEQEHFNDLSIEKTDPTTIAVNHFFIANDDVCYNPRIEFSIHVDEYKDWYEWTPLYMQSMWGNIQTCATVEEDGTLVIINPELHMQIAEYAEGWARRIRLNRWFEDGRKTDAWSYWEEE